MVESDKYITYQSEGGSPIKAWTRGVPFDAKAQEQVRNVANLPFIHGWIAVMPDVHWGMGSTIGSVIPTVGAIIPATVGVDIGCGMMAAKTTLTASQLPNRLCDIRRGIEMAVPHGRSKGGRKGDRGAWQSIPKRVYKTWDTLSDRFSSLVNTHPKLANANSITHLGTLGTGNHFIEVCLDESDAVWVMLHTGSRGIGHRIGMYFIELAKKDMLQHKSNLPDENLAYFSEGSMHFDQYVEAIGWAQDFAHANRATIMESVLNTLQQAHELPKFEATRMVVDCHHNYVNRETHLNKAVWVTRKGAVRAGAGELGIIPGSMGAQSYIVRGKGSENSFHSCSHGAGRVMSRTEAKKRFSLSDHLRATKGIECRKDTNVLDETPGAYKNIDAVMKAQSDLVDIVHTLRQVICVKG